MDAKDAWEDGQFWNPERSDRPEVIVTDHDIETLTLKKQASYWMLPGTSDQNPREMIPFLDDMMNLLPIPQRQCALEIGLGAGGTHMVLASLFQHTITVERDRDRACHTGLGLGKNSTIIVANSKVAATVEYVRKAQRLPIRLLFIDGHHSYESCRTDHELYSPLVEAGGIVAFHDSAKQDCGVKDYLSELPYDLVRYEFPITKSLDDLRPKFPENPGVLQGIAYYVAQA